MEYDGSTFYQLSIVRVAEDKNDDGEIELQTDEVLSESLHTDKESVASFIDDDASEELFEDEDVQMELSEANTEDGWSIKSIPAQTILLKHR